MRIKRTHEMKGGDDDNISKILGVALPEFISKIKSTENLDEFTYGKYEPNKVTANPKGPQKNDIHYEYTQLIMSITRAFAEIEKPTPSSIRIAEFTEPFEKIIGEIFKEDIDAAIIPTFYQFPINPDITKIKYLFPASAYLHGPHFTTLKASDQNIFKLCLNYLYIFISLLDVDNLTGKDVIDFLESDNSYFMVLINLINHNFIEEAKKKDAKKYENIKPVSRKALLASFYKVADAFIQKTREINIAEISGLNETDIRKNVAASGTYDATILQGIIAAICPGTTTVALTEAVGTTMGDLGATITGTTTGPHYNVAIRNLLYLLQDNASLDVTLEVGEICNVDLTGGGSKLKKKQYRGGVKVTAHTTGPSLLIPPTYLYKYNSTDKKCKLINQPTATIVAGLFGDDGARGIIRGVLIPFITAVEALATFQDKLMVMTMYQYAAVDYPVSFKALNLTAGGAEAALGTKLLANKVVGMNDRFNLAKDEADKYNDQITNYISSFINPLYFINVNANNQESNKHEKRNLADVEMFKFFNTYVKHNVPFYDNYFNIIETKDDGTTEDHSIDTIADQITLDNAMNFRLNVKKKVKATPSEIPQTGGGYGDIIFIDELPIYDTSKYTGIYVTLDKKISTDDIINILGVPQDVFKHICRSIMEKPEKPTILNIPINVDKFYNTVATLPLMHLNEKTYYENAMEKILKGQTRLGPSYNWTDFDKDLSEHIMKEYTEWEREDDNFIRKDKNGKTIDIHPVDSCEFINNAETKCLDFMSNCLATVDNNTGLATSCLDLLTYDFDINPGMQSLKDKVNKINPMIAYRILNKFKFGYYIEEVENGKLKKFRRRKVQSVGSWLKEIIEGSKCQKGGANEYECRSIPLRELLGETAVSKIIALANNPAGHNFFKYLSILVNWVNANPQVLNPEEILDVNDEYDNIYPPPNPSFNLYNHKQPVISIRSKLIDTCYGLNRMHNSISNGMIGVNGPFMISQINSVPTNFSMPLARPGFVTAIPSPAFGMVSMTGGRDQTEQDVLNYVNLSGYDFFTNVYESLLDSVKKMNAMKIKSKIGSNTTKKIVEKLSNFKEQEKELRNQLRIFIERNKLYNAARGHIDTFSMSDEDFNKIRSKHSNLLDISKGYNAKAISLIQVMKTLAYALLERLNDYNGDTIKRPLPDKY